VLPGRSLRASQTVYACMRGGFFYTVRWLGELRDNARVLLRCRADSYACFLVHRLGVDLVHRVVEDEVEDFFGCFALHP